MKIDGFYLFLIFVCGGALMAVGDVLARAVARHAVRIWRRAMARLADTRRTAVSCARDFASKLREFDISRLEGKIETERARNNELACALADAVKRADLAGSRAFLAEKAEEARRVELIRANIDLTERTEEKVVSDRLITDLGEKLAAARGEIERLKVDLYAAENRAPGAPHKAAHVKKPRRNQRRGGMRELHLFAGAGGET